MHWLELPGKSNEELAKLDPLEMNLLVAKGIPSLADLDIAPYRDMLDRAAKELRAYLPAAEENFRRNPELWKNDIRFARLALMCWYVGAVMGVQYIEDQKLRKRIRYTNPGDLFLNGVLDNRRGTCGNMSMVYVALAWRMGWPLRLACVASHYICCYDDGEVVYNIEATKWCTISRRQTPWTGASLLLPISITLTKTS